MKKNYRVIAHHTRIVLVIILCVGSVVGVKLYKHEKWQSGQIHTLTAQMRELKETNDSLSEQLSAMQDQLDKLQGKVEYSDNAYNYLAIGNSITLHGLADYWWNEIGMAATTAENDYVHLVSDYLEDSQGAVRFYAMNYYKWEIQSHDRAETYETLDPYLSTKLNLITVQLSENVSDTTTFESDFEALIRYISQQAPNAKIMVIGDFWDNGEKEEAKKAAANKAGVQYISLDEIKGNPEYRCGIGTTVYDAKGDPHIVEHNGVAGHPGDKGMRYIADKIIDALKSE